jgi:hypothetical protein
VRPSMTRSTIVVASNRSSTFAVPELRHRRQADVELGAGRNLTRPRPEEPAAGAGAGGGAGGAWWRGAGAAAVESRRLVPEPCSGRPRYATRRPSTRCAPASAPCAA